MSPRNIFNLSRMFSVCTGKLSTFLISFLMLWIPLIIHKSLLVPQSCTSKLLFFVYFHVFPTLFFFFFFFFFPVGYIRLALYQLVLSLLLLSLILFGLSLVNVFTWATYYTYSLSVYSKLVTSLPVTNVYPSLVILLILVMCHSISSLIALNHSLFFLLLLLL